MYAHTLVYALQLQAYASTLVYLTYTLQLLTIYLISINRVLVNIQGRVVLIEAYSIFICNLSYKCNLEDLNRLLLQTVRYSINI